MIFQVAFRCSGFSDLFNCISETINKYILILLEEFFYL